jgi:DNA-binding CsgD family transcriptional regulator
MHMHSFNRFAIEILQTAKTSTITDFQQHALELIRSVCAFDMATWGAGTFVQNSRPKYHCLNLHGIPNDVYKDFDRVAHTDAVSDEVAKRPYENAASFNLKERFVDPRYKDYLAYARRYGFTNLLYATRPGVMANSLDFISLFRRSRSFAFTAADVGLSRDLLFFAIEAGAINHQLALRTADRDPLAEQESFQAVASSAGVVISADDGFHELVSRQWPRHRAPFLPQELLQALLRTPDRKYFGTAMVVSASIHASTLLLVARPGNKLAVLTPSQLRVVKLIADGHTNKDAAAQLAISVATVRNHLTAAYAKLRVERGFTGTQRHDKGRSRSHWKKTALLRWWMEQGRSH